MSNSTVTHLFAFLTYISAPLYCSFARKKSLLSTDKGDFFSMISVPVGTDDIPSV